MRSMLPWCIMKMGSRGEFELGMKAPMLLCTLLCGVLSNMPWLPPPMGTHLGSRLFCTTGFCLLLRSTERLVPKAS